MTTSSKLFTRLGAVRDRLEKLQWVPQFLVRVFVGYFFFETGLSKIQNLGAMTERFTNWGIPMPAFSAALSGYTELLGGALILVGLGTRLVSVPLFINMLVAVVTVKVKGLEEFNEFFEMDEPLYALTFLWLFFAGPGLASIDALIERLLRRRRDTPNGHAPPIKPAEAAG